MAKVVAEIGCNHKGDLEVAKELIKVAHEFCGADYAKFQKRCNKELLTEKEYTTPHPVPENSYGSTYGAHREFLELDLDQHKMLFDYCESIGIKYACSAWDVTSMREILSLGPDFVKIPSACNLNFELLGEAISGFKGEVHCSLGMTAFAEEDKIMNFFAEKGASDRLVLYGCTSGYPVPFDQIKLLEITRLSKKYAGKFKTIGYSGHHLGIAIDVAALTLGAEWLERHFTLDRTWKGTDHAASLEPDGLRKLCRDIKNVKSALKVKEQDILAIEEETRKKLKRV